MRRRSWNTYANNLYKMIEGGDKFLSPFVTWRIQDPIKTLEIFASDTVFIYSDFAQNFP
jgi:hypothetical protein